MSELIRPEKVRRVGNVRFFKTPAGSKVIMLPTCTVPPEHLIKENWDAKSIVPYRSLRNVLSVSHLVNGKKITDTAGKEFPFFVKGSERYFYPFAPHWAPRFVSGSADFSNLVDSRVEKQVVREARLLLELAHSNIRAEVPQAFAIHSDGRREIIVKDILGAVRARKETIATRLRARVRRHKFIPVDLAPYNVLVDSAGNKHIIDVNRWSKLGLTDKYDRMLAKAVSDELAKRMKP